MHNYIGNDTTKNIFVEVLFKPSINRIKVIKLQKGKRYRHNNSMWKHHISDPTTTTK